MSKSVKATVDDQLAMESDQLQEQISHKICTTVEAHVYEAEKLSSTKCSQFQVHLNRARQAATAWCHTDRQKAIERERDIHQVTSAKCQLFDKLLQRHHRQLLQDVGMKAICPRSKFGKELALNKTGAEGTCYGAAIMTTDKRLQIWLRLTDAETEATTWSLADTERVTN
jgi:hypothetical protein